MVTPPDILGFDPGLTNPGVAIIRNGLILKADRLPSPKAWMKLGILDRSDRVAQAALEWFRTTPSGGLRANILLVVEWPQWYGDNEKGIDQNDLAGLCAISGSLLGRLRAAGHQVEAKSPTPREVWGNIPKAKTGDAWISPRAARLIARISPYERSVIASKHDALDGAGLALWGAGRWTARRVMPGAV